MKKVMRIVPLFLVFCVSVVPAAVQERYRDGAQDQMPPVQQSLPEIRPGQTAASAAGQIGQRQTRERVAAKAGIEPMNRIAGRIQNRVQSRVRNRIDRYYDPQANAASPFTVAGDQARNAGRYPR